VDSAQLKFISFFFLSNSLQYCNDELAQPVVSLRHSGVNVELDGASVPEYPLIGL
jgi:hypothetical protein